MQKHRLDRVLSVAQRKQQQEAAKLAQLNRQLLEQQQRKQQLLQYGNEYRLQLTNSGRRGISASLYKGHSEFIGHIQASIDNQADQLINLENLVAVQTQAWQQAHTKVKSLQRAIEKDLQLINAKRERMAEQATDEWSQRPKGSAI